MPAVEPSLSATLGWRETRMRAEGVPRVRNPTPVSRRAATLSRAELALYRGYIQGLELRDLHRHYFEEEPADLDLRRLKGRVREIARELAAAARRTDRPHLAGLFARDPRLLPVDRSAPTPEEFAQRYDADMYSERELQELWEEEYGGRTGASSAAGRRVRLVERQLEALGWIEVREFPAPELVHRVDLWVSPLYATKLQTAGIDTVADLVDAMRRGGRGWHRNIRGIGDEKARRLEDWVRRHVEPGGLPMLPAALLPRSQILQRSATAPRRNGIVPLERLQLPAGLDGTQGRFRAPAALCTLSAGNDLQAVQAWLRTKISPHTRRAYQCEAERLLLWCTLLHRKPMSSLTIEDCAAYQRFLRDPQPASDWCGPPGVPRWSSEWRPFAGPLRAPAERRALVILNALGAWLRAQNYLLANPWSAISTPPAPGKGLDTRRSLTPSQWAHVSATLANLGDAGARARLKFAAALLYTTGVRVSEAVGLRLRDVQRNEGHGGRRTWSLRMVGKGQKERRIPLASVTVEQLSRYLVQRGLPASPDLCDGALPLLARVQQVGRGALQGREFDPCTPVDAGTLYRQIRGLFRLAAKSLEVSDPAGAARLRSASTHWLRHTFGTAIVSLSKDVRVARDLLGHASIATTNIYLDSDDDHLRETVDELARTL